jgi:hypothetical protein
MLIICSLLLLIMILHDSNLINIIVSYSTNDTILLFAYQPGWSTHDPFTDTHTYMMNPVLDHRWTRMPALGGHYRRVVAWAIPYQLSNYDGDGYDGKMSPTNSSLGASGYHNHDTETIIVLLCGKYDALHFQGFSMKISSLQLVSSSSVTQSSSSSSSSSSIPSSRKSKISQMLRSFPGNTENIFNMIAAPYSPIPSSAMSPISFSSYPLSPSSVTVGFVASHPQHSKQHRRRYERLHVFGGSSWQQEHYALDPFHMKWIILAQPPDLPRGGDYYSTAFIHTRTLYGEPAILQWFELSSCTPSFISFLFEINDLVDCVHVHASYRFPGFTFCRLYDIAADTWSRVDPFPNARSHSQFYVTLPSNGDVLVMGLPRPPSRRYEPHRHGIMRWDSRQQKWMTCEPNWVLPTDQLLKACYYVSGVDRIIIMAPAPDNEDRDAPLQSWTLDPHDESSNWLPYQPSLALPLRRSHQIDVVTVS